MRIIGLDLSLSNTGYYCYEEHTSSESLIKTNNKSTIENRINNITSQVMELINNKEPELIVIEGPFIHLKHMLGSMNIIGLNMTVRCAIAKTNYPFIVVHPTELKKFATGKGNAKKEMMMACATLNFNKVFTNDNICDAFWLTQWGLKHG